MEEAAEESRRVYVRYEWGGPLLSLLVFLASVFGVYVCVCVCLCVGEREEYDCSLGRVALHCMIFKSVIPNV